MSKAKEKSFNERFKNGFKILTRSKSPYEVWADLMMLFSIEISNTVTKQNELLKSVWNEREEQYKKVAAKYDKHERTKIIPQMFAALVMELEENPNQDLLGKLYMELEISNKNAGQFFTPYHVCQLMAQITIDKPKLRKEVKEKGYISIYEPTCGAGANLIAAVEQCRSLFNRLNFQNHVYFMAQDLDITIARMCYIQLSLLGVAGVVKVGNTLTDPEFSITKENMNQFYFTPMWFSGVWVMRRMFHGFDLCMNKLERKGKNGENK